MLDNLKRRTKGSDFSEMAEDSKQTISIYRSESDTNEDKDKVIETFDIEKDEKSETAEFLGKRDDTTVATKPAEESESFGLRVAKLAICFFGLQISYITWGVLQEKVMTSPYETGYFPSATFLVFGNRFIAIFVALGLVYYPVYFQGQQLGKKSPLYWYAPCSLSNVLSSYAQYECLKFVTFPVQVVSKSCKIIPVMLVGKFVHGKSYKNIEYLEALVITVGVSMFTLSQSEDNGKGSSNTTSFGIFLLAFYLCCDSFTSQWQSKVFDKFHVNQFQMMAGVNTWSVCFTSLKLLQTGELFECLDFLGKNPESCLHVFVLSLTSCTGQLFIFYTIKKFGPVVFTIIMTTRQMLSMVLSCLLFNHSLGFISLIGAIVVFSTLGYRIRRQYLAKRN
mmetsp:Transcript_5089/g.7028  ORF Transcript_5089/g.7028 Transcript_5089/m.7028 type:complete len:393 (-) Transcript_5089:404-1582(-)